MRKSMEEKKELMVAAMKLPMDVFLGELIISVIGRRAVYVENYRSILFYTDTSLKIQGKDCKLLIQGKHLVIEYYTGDEMKVTGRIESVGLEQ
ncbi:MAG: YabP/YqfC family sporulation protein [Lachnospiraceae bacterium]|nr:YabP/YqfC family sporulation protein [Lachnospiraceae bacterium]MDO5551967.1 YabP/YqfC family sporulation protein [Lachnospiraceae bacterium]